MVYGLYTIDVEPDNVWANAASTGIENLKSLPLIQSLCNEYGVRPTYLVTYSLITSPPAMKILEHLLASGGCEMAAHSHCWEIPPMAASDPYKSLVAAQYSSSVLEDKLATLTGVARRAFGQVSSHRAGRWGLDLRQASILRQLKYTVDSSVTPGLDWSSTGAPDYTGAPGKPYRISESLTSCSPEGVLEVPCTVRPAPRLFGLERTRIGSGILRRAGFGPRWLRCQPAMTEAQLIATCAWATSQFPQLNLMTHSSELHPGTSPMWPSDEAVKRHLHMSTGVFQWWRSRGVIPVTLSEFAACWDGRPAISGGSPPGANDADT